MKSNFSYFVKFVYYTYLVGLVLLLLDIPGFLLMKGNLLGVFSLLQVYIPFAGLSGLIPVALIFFSIITFGQQLYFFDFPSFFLMVIPYALLPFAIILQRKIINRIKQAMDGDLKREPVFKIVILHHLWTNAAIILIMVYTADFLLKELGPSAFSLSRFLLDSISISWVLCIFLNFLIAFFIWRWTKTEILGL